MSGFEEQIKQATVEQLLLLIMYASGELAQRHGLISNIVREEENTEKRG